MNGLHRRLSVLEIAGQSDKLHVLRHGLRFLHFLLLHHLRQSVFVQITQEGIRLNLLLVLVLLPYEIAISVVVACRSTHRQSPTLLILILQIEARDAIHVFGKILLLSLRTLDCRYVKTKTIVVVILLRVNVLDCLSGLHHLLLTQDRKDHFLVVFLISRELLLIDLGLLFPLLPFASRGIRVTSIIPVVIHDHTRVIVLVPACHSIKSKYKSSSCCFIREE